MNVLMLGIGVAAAALSAIFDPLVGIALAGGGFIQWTYWRVVGI